MAVEASGGPPTPVEASNPNQSVVEGMKWLGVPPGEALPVYRFASPDRYVGSLGQFTSRSQAWSYFEGKREVHRRFTADQRMGFVFSLDDYGRIGVRPEISNFVARCAHMYDGNPNPPPPGDPPTELPAHSQKAATDGLAGCRQATDTATPGPTQGRHRPRAHREVMTHITRSRRLQAGLAGLSVVSAVGAAVGLGLTTHTGHTSTAGQTSSGSGRSTATGSHEGGEGDDDSTTSGSTSSGQSSSNQSRPVTQPSSSAPQATTSGS